MWGGIGATDEEAATATGDATESPISDAAGPFMRIAEGSETGLDGGTMPGSAIVAATGSWGLGSVGSVFCESDENGGIPGDGSLETDNGIKDEGSGEASACFNVSDEPWTDAG